ncbi:MAG: DNA gyrase subunit A, partial [Rickettsiales bacterium]|nr:DNA gyrase subunit A [Rickettsiales bacterium]
MTEKQDDKIVKSADKNVIQTGIVKEMETSYIEYAMSVIISRALPDVRDGFKPVHRRILYAMHQGGSQHNKPYKKSAKTVGDVMGDYHPHGDAAIYGTLVRLAQPFSMGVPLVDGQGNFGSIDGDSPAAMRYTESRLAKISQHMLADLDRDAVDFRPNYDERLTEPVVLPAKFPNLLVNGTGGIAVGMATNIPSHNLGEVIDATIALVNQPNLTAEELLQYVPAPDFPTGGMILGRRGSQSALLTGKGSVVMRGRAHTEEIGGREAIVITEIPYQVNKTELIKRIQELVKDKKLEGIHDLRDESDKQGIRLVVELKKDAFGEIILNQLYRMTQLQSNFPVNMLAIKDGRPSVLNIKEILDAFIEFRKEVIRRYCIYDLSKSRNKAHNLVGLSIAVANIDEVIALIRGSKDPRDAREQLLAKSWNADVVAPLIELIDDPLSKIIDGTYRLSEAQAKAILDLQLQKLTGLEQDKLADEITAIGHEIKDLLDILRNEQRINDIIINDLTEIKEAFAEPRKTEIIESEFEHDIEDLIAREDMVVTVTNTGYIKRVPLSTYRAQKRGGKGRNAMNTKEDDFVTNVFVANTHTPILFFSDTGIAYKLKVYMLPLGSPTSLGKALVNVLPLKTGESISEMLPLPEDESAWENMSIMFATGKGTVRRNMLSDFQSVRANGKIAMKLEEGEKLVNVRICSDNDDILLSTRSGKCIRFPVSTLRVFQSRNSMGVKGVKLSKDDDVISMSVLKHIDLDSDTRTAYIKASRAKRRDEVLEGDEEVQNASAIELSEDKFDELEISEEFILTISDTGFGK